MELKRAIVTGASSGIGLAVSQMLASEGFAVFGIGRQFGESGENDFLEERIVMDITDTDKLVSVIERIGKTGGIDCLVNCAGSAYYGLSETIAPEQIHEMCQVDFEAPVIAASVALPYLRKSMGIIVNVASVTATRINTHGACYGALKAGLRSFGRSLYEEVRKHGVRVITVCPDLTSGTGLYRNADFEASDEAGESLLPEDVAECVRTAITMRQGANITELEIRPQFNRITKKGQKET